LAAFALLVVFPVVVLAGVLLLNSVSVARAQAEARLTQLAAAASANIDREMERHVLVLNTLSTLPSFGTDWPTFYDRATRALQGDGYIVVVDRDLRQLANTYVPYGQHPPRTGDPETAQRVLASRRPEASNVFTSLVTGGRVINFALPVLRNGEVRYILCYGRPAAHLTGILHGQSLERGWTSAVFDGHGALIASSGRAAAQSDRVQTSDSGLSRWTDESGDTILRATQVSETTGWAVTVDVPEAVVMREANGNLQWWTLFALGAVLAAIGLGVAFGQFLSRQLRGAAAYAGAIGREDDAAEMGPTTLEEIGAISAALQSARAELRRRMEQQAHLSRELNHRVKNLLSVVQAMVALTFANKANAGQARRVIMQRLQSLSRSQDLLTRSDWTALPLRQLVEMEVAPFADRISFEGPDVSVSANNVQNFGLILHELTTNAVKYGALRDDAGRIALRWSVAQADGGQRFVFRWKEHCTPAAGAGEKRGFGSTLLQRAFHASDSEHRLEIEPDGFVCEFDTSLQAITGEPDADEGAAGAQPAEAPTSKPAAIAPPPRVQLGRSPA
jgi:two-component sensor histidine kinase